MSTVAVAEDIDLFAGVVNPATRFLPERLSFVVPVRIAGAGIGNRAELETRLNASVRIEAPLRQIAIPARGTNTNEH